MVLNTQVYNDVAMKDVPLSGQNKKPTNPSWLFTCNE